MLTDQGFVQKDGGVNGARGQVPLQTSAEFVRSYKAQAHETIDAMTAVVMNAQAGLNWLRAQPRNLEEVREALINIANDGKRAAEIVVRLRELMNEGTHSGGLS
jgi:hypothetical protein